MEKVKIFISYASEDHDTAKMLYDDLKKEGAEPWLDTEDLFPGQNWRAQIPDIIKNSSYFLLLISQNSVSKTGFIQKEQKIALDLIDELPPNKVFIIPARIDSSELFYAKLKDIHWADFTSSYKRGFSQVLKSIKMNGSIRFTPSYDDEVKKLMNAIKPIEFVNRLSELQIMTHTHCPTYLLVAAPMGYGKTRLLEAIKEDLENKENWLCLSINFSDEETYSIKSIASSLLKCLGKNSKNFHLKTPEEAGDELGNCILETVGEKQHKGILIQTDDAESLDSNIVKELLNRFVPKLADTINNAANPVKLRLIFAGRYIVDWPQMITSGIRFKTILLTPFDFETVYQTVEKYDSSGNGPKRPPDYKKNFSAWLMYFTGGHPKCMAEILRRANGPKIYGLSMDTIITREQTLYYDEFIKPVIEDIIKNFIPPKLREILYRLSAIRRFNAGMLREFMNTEENVIKWSESEFKLENALCLTYLVTRKEDGFLQDDITRRLLSNDLRKSDLPLFINLCKRAIGFYEKRLRDKKAHRRDIIALELLFQKLQCHFFERQCQNDDQNIKKYEVNKKKPKHKKIFSSTQEKKEQFLKESDGILKKLVSVPNPVEVMESFIKVLTQDWEFHFTFNYLFREGVYNERFPFNELTEKADMVLGDLKKSG